MIRYARDIATLLHGCGRAFLAALVLCAGSALVDMLCMALLPLFLLAMIAGPDAALASAPLPGALSTLLRPYATLVAVVIAAFVLRGALTLYVGAQLARLSETIRSTLIGKLTRHYLTCPYQEYSALSIDWIHTVIGAYTGTFASSVVLPLLRLLLEGFTMVAILAFLLMVDHRVVGITSIALAAVAVAYYLAVRRSSDRQSKRLSEYQARFNSDLSRSLFSPRDVRVFQLQDHFLRGMKVDLDHASAALTRLTVIASLPRVLGEFTLIGLALGYLAYRTHTGIATAVMMSQLGLLAFAGLRLLPAFAQALAHVSALKAGRHATRLLLKEFDYLPATPPPEPRRAEPPAEPFEAIELRQVSFGYSRDRTPVLRDVDLRIERGESVGVVGPSGAGKSTLADVLLGLLEPSSGQTLLNGTVERLSSRRWWRMVGFVPQTVILSNDTLLRNIAFGLPEDAIDVARATRAASMAQLDDLLQELPDGLQTIVGDFGVRLSGGQRQRVAIARALYYERQFLVLDEATSALDSETERAVVRAVGSLHGKVTTFIIAHRHSTLEGCDMIVEVRDGRLATVRDRRAEMAREKRANDS